MRPGKEIISAVWRRHQNPWNWLVQALGGVLLLFAVWLRSPVDAWAGLGLALAGALDFHLPPFPETGFFPGLVRRAIRAEVVWVNRRWDRKKGLGALLMFLGLALVLAALWWDSLPGLGLTVGAIFLLRARTANREAGVDP